MSHVTGSNRRHERVWETVTPCLPFGENRRIFFLRFSKWACHNVNDFGRAAYRNLGEDEKRRYIFFYSEDEETVRVAWGRVGFWMRFVVCGEDLGKLGPSLSIFVGGFGLCYNVR